MPSATTLRFVSSGLVFLSAAIIWNLWCQWMKDDVGYFQLVCISLIEVAVVAGLVTVAAVSFDISRRKPCENCSISKLYKLWKFYRMVTSAKPMSVDDYTKNGVVSQEKAFKTCLELNASTKYAEDHGLSGIKNMAEFREKHPLTTYDHYRSYIERRLEGETNMLLNEDRYPVDFFAYTSGTSGKNKMYPYNFGLYNFGLMYATMLMGAALRKTTTNSSGPSFLVQTFAALATVPKPSKTKTGIDCGSIATKSIPAMPEVLLPYPKLLFQIHTEHEFYYVASVFTLQGSVTQISHSLAPSTLSFYKLLEDEWRSICDDIERGQLKSDLDIPKELREQIVGHLKPNPSRARKLRDEFSKGLHGIVRRVWPDVKWVVVILTGSFSNYREPLEYYLKGVLMYTNMHGATEGIFGANMWPMEAEPRFLLCVSQLFYEFVPEEDIDSDNPTTTLAHQVEVGKTYELVITSPQGFYRFRTGDVIKIVGFQDQVPIYQFKYRAGQMLNAHWEKTPESAFMDALRKTVSDWGDDVMLIEYTATEGINMNGIGGQDTSDRYYVVFVELGTKATDSKFTLSKDQKKQFDDNLKACHELYGNLRDKDELQPMVVHQVKPGCFESLKTIMRQDNENISSAQFKMPRVQRNKKYLQFLLENSISD